MIRIARDRTDEASVPIRPDNDWFERAREATEDAKREGRNHKARSDVYGHPLVRAALEKLFHDKCAYCESTITQSEWEVEHFRPKGQVAERPEHPGYYWLIYEWTNLYPSCSLCNKRRHDKPRWGDRSSASVGGKGSQFPLADEAHRAMTADHDLALERPLLLDPCLDDPASYLTFNVRGEILSLGDHSRGRATIAVFHLNRRRLRDLRSQTVGLMLGSLNLLATRLHELSDAAKSDFAAWFKQYCLGDHCAYAGVARSVLRDPTAFGLVTEGHQAVLALLAQ